MNKIERARQLRAVIEKMSANLPDTVAVESPELFPEWNEEAVKYVAGSRIRHNGILYVVLQNHTSQPDWTPAAVPSLFAKVLIPDPDVIPEWEQPDSTNPYMSGDKVRYGEKTYESLIDNNVWSPAIYPAGWKEVNE